MYLYMSHVGGLDLLIPNCGHEAGPFLVGGTGVLIGVAYTEKTEKFRANSGSARVTHPQLRS